MAASDEPYPHDYDPDYDGHRVTAGAILRASRKLIGDYPPIAHKVFPIIDIDGTVGAKTKIQHVAVSMGNGRFIEGNTR